MRTFIVLQVTKSELEELVCGLQELEHHYDESHETLISEIRRQADLQINASKK